MKKPSGSSALETAISRRKLLTALSALAGAGLIPRAAAQAGAQITLPEFQDLFAAVTGYGPADPLLGKSFLEAFASELGELARLRDIVFDNPEHKWQALIAGAGLDGLAESLVLAGYTGIVGEGATAHVITYLNAFVWHAVGYTKPPSQCDWDFGAWALPPPRGRFEE